MVVGEFSATEKMEKILLVLQEKDGIVVKEISAKAGVSLLMTYRSLRTMNVLSLIKNIKGKIFLLKMENNEEEHDILSFLKILNEFGLTNLDMKILRAKGENSEEISQQTGMLANIVQQRKANILLRLGVGNLKQARRKINNMKRILA